MQPSFERGFDASKVKYAPCDQVGELLSQILSARERQLDKQVNNRGSTDASDSDKFYEWYWDACRASEFEVAGRLGPLLEGTRNGEIVWHEVSLPSLSIEDHPELKPMATSLADRYLEATFLDRPLVVVILRDVVTIRGGGTSRTEHGYFLAARRPNGTLTPGVWPDDCQSNLIYEIVQAFRRAATQQEFEQQNGDCSFATTSGGIDAFARDERP